MGEEKYKQKKQTEGDKQRKSTDHQKMEEEEGSKAIVRMRKLKKRGSSVAREDKERPGARKKQGEGKRENANKK